MAETLLYAIKEYIHKVLDSFNNMEVNASHDEKQKLTCAKVNERINGGG